MIKRLRDWMKEVLIGTMFACILFTVNLVFILKSNGLLKTEEEWYSFGACLMQIIPMIMAFVIVFHFVTFFVFYSIEKIYKYIRG